MRAVAEKTTTIQLIQTKYFKSHYEFRTEGQTIGEIRYSGFAGKRAEAKIFNEEWKIEQSGFWKTFIEYKSGQSPYEKGKMRSRMSCASEFVSRDNKKFTFKKAKWWNSCWSWYDEAGNEVMKFKDTFSFKKQAEIRIHDMSLQNKAILLLIGTTLVLNHQRAAVAAISA